MAVRGAGSQGVQNGSISCIALPESHGVRGVLAENLIATLLDLEVAGNDAMASIRKSAKLMLQFLPGTDLDAVLEGQVRMEDLGIAPEALELQAQVAEAAGRVQLAENLRRAAEQANVAEEFILEVYNSLRPGRASKGPLTAPAVPLEERYGAKYCAALVREAAG